MSQSPTLTAYLDSTDATLAVVKPNGTTTRTLTVPPGIAASHTGRQAAWARSVLARHGYVPTREVQMLPWGIVGIPLDS